jgi:hypothetical protein
VYRALCHTNQQDAIADLLNNLMHLSDRDPSLGGFDDELSGAYENYEWETEAD